MFYVLVLSKVMCFYAVLSIPSNPGKSVCCSGRIFFLSAPKCEILLLSIAHFYSHANDSLHLLSPGWSASLSAACRNLDQTQWDDVITQHELKRLSVSKERRYTVTHNTSVILRYCINDNVCMIWHVCTNIIFKIANKKHCMFLLISHSILYVRFSYCMFNYAFINEKL